MKQLLFKEFKLAVHPTNYIFLACGALLLIPTWPYYVAFFYTTLALFFIFLTGRENNDVLFSALLPVKKSDIVRARCAVFAIFEVASVVLSLPFVALRRIIIPEPSYLTDCNVAFFGLVFVMYALFNAIFIPHFYRTAHKINYVVPCIAIFVFILIAEALVFFPVIGPYLDAVSPSGMLAQLPVLIGGIAVFALGMLLTCRKAIANFEKVDL